MKLLVTRLLPPKTQARLEQFKYTSIEFRGIKLTQWRHDDIPIPRKELEQLAPQMDAMLVMLTDRMDKSLLEKSTSMH
jgi:hypothetical protein